MSLQESYSDYPVFKGLQRPLEFFGFQGRYIYWAAGTVGGSVLCFLIVYILTGFLPAIAVGTTVLAFGGVFTFIKQRKGLHSKTEDKGTFVLAHTRQF